MALKEEFAKSGALLFQWRSYLPLVFLPLFLVAMRDLAHVSADDSLGERWGFFCIGVSFAGLALRAFVVGQTPARTSGRNTREQVADSLNTTGMYSVVRHPLYLGNFIAWTGVAMFTQSFLVVLVSVLAFALYYERIMFAEEKFLREKFRGDFDRWADRTPAFVPRFSQWRKSAVPFSWGLAAEREYSGMFAIVVTYSVLELARGWFQRGTAHVDPAWAIFFVAGTAAYVWLRSLKKKRRRAASVSSRL
ncbi:MAG TPA: isoprenylcysteine carboxylmethyltransferase family protein [Candidatus Binatia bacterium]